MIEPEDDLLADMYEMASEILEKHGFEQYEISNWAIEMPDGSTQMLACTTFNIGETCHTWVLELVLMAVRKGSGWRTLPRCRIISCDPLNPGKNLFPMSFATDEFQKYWHRYEQMQETMMLGLRLTKEGVSERDFFARFGEEPREMFGRQIDRAG